MMDKVGKRDRKRDSDPTDHYSDSRHLLPINPPPSAPRRFTRVTRQSNWMQGFIMSTQVTTASRLSQWLLRAAYLQNHMVSGSLA